MYRASAYGKSQETLLEFASKLTPSRYILTYIVALLLRRLCLMMVVLSM